MKNTIAMYTKYAPIIMLRKSLEDAEKTKKYLLSIIKCSDISEEIQKIDLYIKQFGESIILLQENRNKDIRSEQNNITNRLIN